jgi:5,10-methylenetetrahydromethanopterin reductase
MDIGIFVAPVAKTAALVHRAEGLGYGRAWFYDTQMLTSELFVSMTAAAMSTTRIRLGTGVLIPSNRIAPVTASGLATLNALAPGRIDFGVSTGSTARSTMGLPRIKQSDLEEYIRVVYGLLRRDTVEWDYEGKKRKIRFLDPDIGAINLTDEIPLHVSAFGPRGRALIARLKAGWIDVPGSVERGRANIAEVQAAWTAAGNAPGDLYATAYLAGCILRDGESPDSPRVKSIAGPMAMIVLHKAAETPPEAGPTLPARFQPLVERYREIHSRYEPSDARYLTNHRGHLMYLRPEEHEVCTPELISTFTMTCSKAEMSERVQELKRAGFRHFGVEVLYRHPEVMEDWLDVFNRV